MTKVIDFPIELRHPDGGSMLFNTIDEVVSCFLDRKNTHHGIVLFPSDFDLYVNNRHYSWSKECLEFPSRIEFDWKSGLAEYRSHLRYVMDIEIAFYDVNTKHEDKIPESS